MSAVQEVGEARSLIPGCVLLEGSSLPGAGITWGICPVSPCSRSAAWSNSRRACRVRAHLAEALPGDPRFLRDTRQAGSPETLLPGGH